MFTLSDSQIFIIFITLMISIPTITTFITIFFFIRPLRNIVNEQSRIIYTLTKQNEGYRRSIRETSQNITLLSSSVESTLEEFKDKKQAKIFPTPELAKQITETIREHIQIETILVKDLRLTDKSTVDNIVYNVHLTYPNVHNDYIAKKTLAVIESYIQQNTG